MAGSKKYFVYTTDQGDDFALLADESNTEVVNGGTQDFPNGTPPTLYTLPRNVTPRQLIYRSVDGTVTRRVYALTPAILAGAGGAVASFPDPVSGQTVNLVRQLGEIIAFPFGPDTGQQDGDAT